MAIEDGTDLPSESSYIIIYITYSITLFISLYLLLKASTTDPGIIPRKNDNSENIEKSYKEMIDQQDNKQKYFINRKLLQKSVTAVYMGIITNNDNEDAEDYVDVEKDGGSEERSIKN